MLRLSAVVFLIVALAELAYAGRYYDAKTGRFLQIDPHADKYHEVSPYCYALNNPLIYIDPDGSDVEFHESARNNQQFNNALNLYLKTDIGSKQMQRFQNDKSILVIYQVGDISKTAAGTIVGFTNWKIGSEQADKVTIGSEEMGIKVQTFENKGKVVITITLDADILGKSNSASSAETIYHEGKAHIEYERDKGDLTGTTLDYKAEHKLYGTDGVSPVKKGSPADKFIKEVEKKKEEENK